MSDHDVQLLALGAAFGSNLTVLLLIALEYVAVRRAVRRARRRNARVTDRNATVADLPPEPENVWVEPQARESSKWVEPHPAEVLEASVRDFELNLLNCLDRVDDALRRDGLL